MVSEQIVIAFNWASWSSIFAGVAAALAVCIVMMAIGTALGFKKIHPTSDEPVSGLGSTMGIWFCVNVLVSSLVGGLVAGLFAVQRGAEHGFMVWAVALIIGTVFSLCALGSAARGAAKAARGAGAGLAGAVHGLGSGAARLAKGAKQAGSGVVAELREHVDFNVDTDQINENITGILRDTGVETLQPEYLRSQLRQARMDLRSLLHELALNPRQAEELIGQFVENQKSRLENLTENVDKETAVRSLMQARDIPEEEARKLVDNGIQAYNRTVSRAKEGLAEAREHAQLAKIHLKAMAERAREKAEKASNKMAKASAGVAVALILAALVSMGGGVLGNWLAFSLYGITRTIVG